jgi:hypothetical protein
MTCDEERAIYEAYRQAIGTEHEVAAYEEMRRRLRVNEPPPGWTVEEDRREEWTALGEHLALRC